MSKASISYEDVCRHARTLIARGENPTNDRIIALHGSGSKSTVGPWLKRFRAEHMGQNDLPEPIEEAVAAVRALLAREAEERVESMRSACDQELASMRGELGKLRELLSESRREAGAVQAENLALSENLGGTLEALSLARSSAAKLEGRLGELEKSHQRSCEQLQQAEEQALQAREHLDHYQAKTAEAMRSEREQAQTERHALERELGEARAREASYRANLEALSAKLGEQSALALTLKEALGELGKAHQSTTHSERQLMIRCEELTEALASRSGQAAELDRELKLTGERLSAKDKEIRQLQGLISEKNDKIKRDEQRLDAWMAEQKKLIESLKLANPKK